MADTQEEAILARLQEALKRMAPEDRKRAIEAAKARLELVHQARQAGLQVETPEQVKAALSRIREAIGRYGPAG